MSSVIGDHKSGPHGTFVRLTPGVRLPLHHNDQPLAGVGVSGNVAHPVPGNPDSQQTLGPEAGSPSGRRAAQTNNVGDSFALFFIYQEHLGARHGRLVTHAGPDAHSGPVMCNRLAEPPRALLKRGCYRSEDSAAATKAASSASRFSRSSAWMENIQGLSALLHSIPYTGNRSADPAACSNVSLRIQNRSPSRPAS